jgi:hypothetical protein
MRIFEGKLFNTPKEREMLHQLLAISVKQLDDGEGRDVAVEDILREGQERRRRRENKDQALTKARKH